MGGRDPPQSHYSIRGTFSKTETAKDPNLIAIALGEGSYLGLTSLQGQRRVLAWRIPPSLMQSQTALPTQDL